MSGQGTLESAERDEDLSCVESDDAELERYEERLRTEYRRRSNGLVCAAVAGIATLACALALQQIGPGPHARPPLAEHGDEPVARGSSIPLPPLPAQTAPEPAAPESSTARAPRTEHIRRVPKRASAYDPYADAPRRVAKARRPKVDPYAD